jgi:hypothetical protein
MPSRNHKSRWGISGGGNEKPPLGGKASLIEEAKKNLLAVINRLHLHGEDDLAEEIFEIVTAEK